MVIDLTQYEKKTFFSFLGLYISSVTILLSVIGILFYQSNYQGNFNSLKSSMEMESKELSSKIIMQDMKGIPKENADFKIESIYNMSFLDNNLKSYENELPEGFNFSKAWNIIGDTLYFLDKSPSGHYGIYYILVSDSNFLKAKQCLKEALMLFGGIYLLMVVVGYILAKLFLKPIIIQRNKLNNFVKDTTHELNTPISAILMCLEDTNNVTQKKFERVKLSVKRISEIYHDLTYLFLENDTTIAYESINVKNILDTQMEYFVTIAQKKDISLVCSIQDTNIPILREDFIRLSNNLISNALKYTNKSGTVEIILNNRYFVVKDNGIGISIEKQRNLFKRFYRGTDEVGGFGIGLNIVYNICQKYGFDIALESEENEGSTFTIKFISS